MGWFDTLKKIGKGADAIGRGVAPFIDLGAKFGMPGAGAADAVLDSIFAAEEKFKGVVKAGPEKMDDVLGGFDASLEVAKTIAAANGQTLIYDSDRVRAAVERQLANVKRSAEIVEEQKAIVAEFAGIIKSAKLVPNGSLPPVG